MFIKLNRMSAAANSYLEECSYEDKKVLSFSCDSGYVKTILQGLKQDLDGSFTSSIGFKSDNSMRKKEFTSWQLFKMGRVIRCAESKVKGLNRKYGDCSKLSLDNYNNMQKELNYLNNQFGEMKGVYRAFCDPSEKVNQTENDSQDSQKPMKSNSLAHDGSRKTKISSYISQVGSELADIPSEIFLVHGASRKTIDRFIL